MWSMFMCLGAMILEAHVVHVCGLQLSIFCTARYREGDWPGWVKGILVICNSGLLGDIWWCR
ncbi:hypothetical protein AMTRI_Chr05g67780 [Amborella trichopoda]